jgi:dTDP-4-dehydrorhamnose reductase
MDGYYFPDREKISSAMEKLAEKKRLLLTGASGFLGWNICRQASKDWEIFGVYLSRSITLPEVSPVKADLRVYKELKDLFENVQPDAVMHTAAVTDPNFCQINQAETRAVNLDASISLAGLCADRRIPLVFTSSDLVFDGLHPPYAESDFPNPVNVYGEQKALAEEGMRKSYPATIICRLPLMFGEGGPAAQSFLQHLIRAMKEGREIRLFTDEFRTPVSGATAARGLFLALEKGEGLLHLGGRQSISRYDFGLLLKGLLKADKANLIPCRQADLKMPAPRPPDVSLKSDKAFGLGFNPPGLEEDLKIH